jgi:dTDP-4-dehydrorhamnose reductase
MKLLVTGSNGQLGSEIIAYSKKAGIPSFGASRQDFDITDRIAVMNFISEYKPDAVIHCASYTAVDRAEDEEELCRRVNVLGTENVARACRICHAKMMYISTDYVFDGTKKGIYETDDATNPLSVYGRSKADGEMEVQNILKRFFIVRTSWLFGNNGDNFVNTIQRLCKHRTQVSVVNDQIGSPTYSKDLAPLLVQMISSDKYGIYHATNEGFCSWAEFAEKINSILGQKCRINRIRSEDYPSKAVRPKNSCLSKEKLVLNGFLKLPPWQDALKRFLVNQL